MILYALSMLRGLSILDGLVLWTMCSVPRPCYATGQNFVFIFLSSVYLIISIFSLRRLFTSKGYSSRLYLVSFMLFHFKNMYFPSFRRTFYWVQFVARCGNMIHFWTRGVSSIRRFWILAWPVISAQVLVLDARPMLHRSLNFPRILGSQVLGVGGYLPCSTDVHVECFQLATCLTLHNCARWTISLLIAPLLAWLLDLSGLLSVIWISHQNQCENQSWEATP